MLLTDITYISYKSKFCYLSTILDSYTHEILAYQTSETLKVEFVLKTELVEKHGFTLDDETIVHSDQRCHYTSYAFINKMKDEIMEKAAICEDREQVTEIVDDWIKYYNNDRYRQGLNMLSPNEYYNFVTKGIDPLADVRI